MLELLLEIFQGGIDLSIIPETLQFYIFGGIMVSGAMLMFSYVIYLIDALAGFVKSLLHIK